MRSSILCSILAFGYSSTANIVNLGRAKSYGVVSGTQGITNVGLTVITGNLGTTAKTVSGFAPGVVTAGVMNIGNLAAARAFDDAKLAYASAKKLGPDADISTLNDLTGKTIYPGVYYAARTITLTGQLFLDARGDSSATWVFQADSALLINLGSSVILTNGAKASNVFWQTGSAATIAVGADFQGSILAYAGIAVKTGASVNGSLIAITESVTLQSNHIAAQKY
ncbi:putative large tegument protein [Rosellinia necatrix]|uniref:Putative large tegument protein n=1 Tax=Rosellinia necatrix TaxID=77044 RepID=A0A1W2TKJ3_ROSNE|nr:putative large tegument protein [Rosellinia necatrix]